MEKKKLQDILNKEYVNLGKINIREMHQATIHSSEIRYVDSIMDKVESIDIEMPIVVAQTYDGYKLIDGYHRLKGKLGQNIIAFVLTSYSIERTTDDLFGFLTKLVEKTITFVDEQILAVGNDLYFIEPNEGCGGCGNGWSEIYLQPGVANRTIKVEKVVAKNEDGDKYDLYINDQFLAKVDTGWGNGYYGGDFEITKIH